jgi:hypothetical protein
MLVMIPPEDLIPVLQAKVARENAKGGIAATLDSKSLTSNR